MSGDVGRPYTHHAAAKKLVLALPPHVRRESPIQIVSRRFGGLAPVHGLSAVCKMVGGTAGRRGRLVSV